jgi:hypothetical protein
MPTLPDSLDDPNWTPGPHDYDPERDALEPDEEGEI